MVKPDRYGKLAPFYRTLEVFTFGKTLSRARREHLHRLAQCENLLIVGEGNGRFLEALIEANPSTQVTVVDSSLGMIRTARRRLQRLAHPVGDRCQFICADIGLWEPAGGSPPFDGVVTHFFWDQFNPETQRRLMNRIIGWLTVDAPWCCADFSQPGSAEACSPIRSNLQGFVLNSLYLAFGLLTRIEASRLHPHPAPMIGNGWSLEKRSCWSRGWIVSDVWVKNAFRPALIEVNSSETAG